MNCPVKTDENIIDNPTWNQNPPFLAPELTTRKDLNGTVNIREHGDVDARDYRLLGTNSRTEVQLRVLTPEAMEGPCAGWWSQGMSIPVTQITCWSVAVTRASRSQGA